MENYKFVIQNEFGQFYWKGNTSSLYGFKDDFNEAYLFKSEMSAKQRIKSLNVSNCVVRTVKLELIKD